MLLALIGYRGTGKSSVALHLASRLGYSCVDADLEVEARAGKSIARIFAEDGEPAFRDWEAAVLADLMRGQRVVVACGGGAVLRAENRLALRAASQVIWLQAPPQSIAMRIAADATTAGRRPNLTAQGSDAEIKQLLAEREPLYRECAHLAIDTEGKAPAQVAEEIVVRLSLLESAGE